MCKTKCNLHVNCMAGNATLRKWNVCITIWQSTGKSAVNCWWNDFSAAHWSALTGRLAQPWMRQRRWFLHWNIFTLVQQHSSTAVQQYNTAVQQHSRTAIQQYNSTIQEYNGTAVQRYTSTTVQQYNNTAVQQYNSTTVQQYNSTAVQLYSSTTVQYSSTTVQYSSTTVQQYNGTAVQQYRSTTAQQYSTTVQRHSSTTVQQYNSTAVQQCSSTAIQQYNGTTIQQYSNIAVQQYNSTAIQQYNSTIQQYSTTTVKQYNGTTVHSAVGNGKAAGPWFSRTTHHWMRKAWRIIPRSHNSWLRMLLCGCGLLRKRAWIWRDHAYLITDPCHAPLKFQSTGACRAELMLLTEWAEMEYKPFNYLCTIRVFHARVQQSTLIASYANYYCKLL